MCTICKLRKPTSVVWMQNSSVYLCYTVVLHIILNARTVEVLRFCTHICSPKCAAFVLRSRQFRYGVRLQREHFRQRIDRCLWTANPQWVVFGVTLEWIKTPRSHKVRWTGQVLFEESHCPLSYRQFHLCFTLYITHESSSFRNISMPFTYWGFI